MQIAASAPPFNRTGYGIWDVESSWEPYNNFNDKEGLRRSRGKDLIVDKFTLIDYRTRREQLNTE